MNKFLLRATACLAVAAVLGGCAGGASAHVGYMQVAVSGDLALTTGAGGVSSMAQQDIESAFGLGDDQGAPYVRAEAGAGVVTFAGSGFLFSDSGTGTLNEDFGGIPASTGVESSLDFANAKLSATFDLGLDIGPVKISPGLAVDLCDVQFSARELTLGTTESFDELLFVPLLFLRTAVELDRFRGVVEVGYLQTPEVDGGKSTVLDLELLAELQLVGDLSAFVGYRLIDLAGYGDSGGDSFDVDLQVSGWMIGGALRF